MHQLWDKGGARITTVFCQNEMGLALSFKMGFTDVISKQKARSPPGRAQNNLSSTLPAVTDHSQTA